MQRIIIKDVANDRETTFDFPVSLSNVDNLNVSIGDILRRCEYLWSDLDSSSCFAVYEGTIKSVKDCVKIDSAASNRLKVIYVYETFKDVCNVSQYHIDEISIQAAKKWINESSALIDSTVTAQLALTLQEAYQQPASQNPAPPAREVPIDGRGRLRMFIDFIHLGLLIRLGLLFTLLQYNRNTTDIRTYYIAGALVLVYLLQSGVLSYLLRTMSRYMIPADNQNAGLLQRLVVYGQSFMEEGVKIPTKEGWFSDVAALVISAFGSFFPGWHPHRDDNPVR